MTNHLSRRKILRTGAAASLAALAQPFVGVPALAAYAARPAVRRNASTMAANDPILTGYRKAIKAMKALPESNPCSWLYQAAIHGAPPGANHTAWRTCEHGSQYFWSWHRMELYWFERIIRKYSGMYDWTIPYWDWTQASQLHLPAPFRAASDALYDASRNSSMNDGTGTLSGSLANSITNNLSNLDFFSAAGAVSGTHGGIHGSIGGNMSSVSTAARDPIFWVHHSQCDRLWNLWLAQGGGRSSPVGDATWRNEKFTFFDECCEELTMTGCEVLRAANQLSYEYEEEPAQVNQYCPLIYYPWKKWVLVKKFDWAQPIVLNKEALTLPLVSREDRELRSNLLKLARSRSENLVLVLSGVEADVSPGASWEVYVGPTNARRRGKSRARSRQLVGIVSLFGQGLRSGGHGDSEDEFKPAEFVFSLDRAVAAAGTRDLEVTFVPVSGVVVDGVPQPPEIRADVLIREINIAVQAAQPQQEELQRDGLQELKRDPDE